METMTKSIFEKTEKGELCINGIGFMPTLEDIQSGAFSGNPIKCMVINHNVNADMINGIKDPLLKVGEHYKYTDVRGYECKIQIEYVAFGALYNLGSGKCLVQFKLVD